MLSLRAIGIPWRGLLNFPALASASSAFACASAGELSPLLGRSYQAVRGFHHSGPEIPGSAGDGKPRSFFLCFERSLLRHVAPANRRTRLEIETGGRDDV